MYAPFNRNHEKMLFMDVHSSELTKYSANAMLATKISLMNELSNIAERVGADIEHVRKGIGSDPRIGYSFIYAGPGYGGSCFPKDVRALSHTAKEYGYDALVLVTDWKLYWIPDYEKLAATMQQKILVDGRNIWPQEEALEHGFTCHAIGRQSVGWT